MGTSRKLRKSYEEVVDAIIDALPVRSVASVQEISEKIGSSWETTWRWLTLIRYIQEQPHIESVKVGKRRGELWRRERRPRE